MTQLGESVVIGTAAFDDPKHDKQTCPWEQPVPPQKGKMKKQDPDEDRPTSLPANLGGELGSNLDAAASSDPSAFGKPKANFVEIHFQEFGEVKYRVEDKGEVSYDSVQVYRRSPSKARRFPLQYAPHHLIPGNASLSGSTVVPYMGDKASVDDYLKGQSSRIKDNHFIGYDVNAARNGVWLPSPYALSMGNSTWPSGDGLKAVKRRLGAALGNSTESFKMAYAAAAIEASGKPARQFHMNHTGYSSKVREILDAIGAKLKAFETKECEFAKGEAQKGKLPPPMGLHARLHALSAGLRRLLIGSVWHEPLFTDELTERYAKDVKQLTADSTLRVTASLKG